MADEKSFAKKHCEREIREKLILEKILADLLKAVWSTVSTPTKQWRPEANQWLLTTQIELEGLSINSAHSSVAITISHRREEFNRFLLFNVGRSSRICSRIC